MAGTEPDCANDNDDCAPVPQNAKTPGIWNRAAVLRHRQARRRAGQRSRPARFLHAAAQRHAAERRVDLPGRAVQRASAGARQPGQAYVTGLVNAIMRGPDWNSTAIFLTLGRLGRILRPRRAAARRRKRLRDTRARNRHQPVRAQGLHRPPDAQPRRVREVHRRRLSRRRSASIRRPTDGPTAVRRSARPCRRSAILRADFDFYQTPRRPEVLPGAIIWNGTTAQ